MPMTIAVLAGQSAELGHVIKEPKSKTRICMKRNQKLLTQFVFYGWLIEGLYVSSIMMPAP